MRYTNANLAVELDPEMLAVVEAFASAIVRMKKKDDDARQAADEAKRVADRKLLEPGVSWPASPEPDLSSGPKLLRINEVAKYLSVSRGTIYRKVSDGTFPAPRKLGRSVRWLSSDIEDWISQLPNNNR